MPFSLLPEWAPQQRIQLCWPSQQEYWGAGLNAAQQTHCKIIQHISQTQTVLLIHSPQIAAETLRQRLSASGSRLSNISLVALENNDIWCRDYGPLSVFDADSTTDSTFRLLDFRFTGWGGKFPAELDNAVTAKLAAAGHYPRAKSFDLILEGGAIDYDGNGSLLTTSACLLNENRNRGMSKDEYQAFFLEHMGVQQIHWLENGYLAGDDTDSHVDMLARFAPNNRIIFQACDNDQDEHFAALQQLQQELKTLRNVSGEAYELLALPLPEARFDDDGERLPASYANFLVTNQQVLVPSYNCPQDAIALALIAGCFPERDSVAVNCEALIQQYGSLHCATMQLAV